jgi:hypothetical protein
MQDTVLAGYHVPAGTDVVYLSWLMARDQVTITYFFTREIFLKNDIFGFLHE